MAASALPPSDPPRRRWKYRVRYVSAETGEPVTAEGMVPLISQEVTLKYLGKKYRKLSKTGLLLEVSVEEVTKGQPTVTAAAVSSALRNVSRPPVVTMNPGQATVPSPYAAPPPETFAKKACFIYRFMGQPSGAESKKHKFYEVVPHY
jgi:hypothetical protein